MKKLSYLTCIALLTSSFTTFAEPSANHSGQASKHSALAVSHGVVGSSQVASAAVAIPLVVGGSLVVSAGTASVELGEGASKMMTSKPSRVKQVQAVELEVTEITITVDRSPAEAMKQQ